MAESSSPVNLEAYKCPICLDFFENPVRIGCLCKQAYCRECAAQNTSRKCPNCQAPANLLQTASDIGQNMKMQLCHCQWCGKQMMLVKLKEHTQKCQKANRCVPKFKPVKETSQSVPSYIANRSTFECPFCPQRNLDCPALIEHVNNCHKHCPQNVVCPVCASMPWGDTSQVSANFLQHLNHRHKFEYATYVDYSQDDDDMLNKTLAASLHDF